MYYVDIICFSFYVAHIIQGGVGGISITNDSKLANLMRSLVNHGRRPTYITIDDKPVNLTDRFTFDYPGYSYRITEFESALALSNLHCIDRILLQRQYNAHELKQGLSSYQSKLQLPFIRLESEHSWMMFPIIILDNTNKLVLCNFLEEHGIETRDMLPLIEQPIANKYYGILDTNKYPVSMNLINKGFYISCSDHLNNTDICHIIKTFEEFYYV